LQNKSRRESGGFLCGEFFNQNPKSSKSLTWGFVWSDEKDAVCGAGISMNSESRFAQ